MCQLTVAEQLEDGLLPVRFVLVGVVGSGFAVFGVVANSLLATLFLTRKHYRHSPFFFLGFVALFDTLLDATYIFLLAVPIFSKYYSSLDMFLMWIDYMPLLYFCSQCSKTASVFCLIVASIERYCMTKHWTFSGFEPRTRWIVLVFVSIAAVILKLTTMEVVIIERLNCTLFRQFTVGTRPYDSPLSGFLGTTSIGIPFLTLVFLNGGIVLMLRRQNVQQLRSLITQLTMGVDAMRLRRRNLREATYTLLAIITAYLISNALNLILTTAEFAYGDSLHRNFPVGYRIAADLASVLTAVGNAIRCPMHFISSLEIRQQFTVMCFGEECGDKIKSGPPNASRRASERLESAFLSLILSVQPGEDGNCVVSHSSLPTSPFLLAVSGPRRHKAFKRHSQIAIC